MIEAPLKLYHDVVRPEWLDYNNHLTEGFFVVIFADASDTFLDYMGLDARYRDLTGNSVYTLEAHINYLRELKEGSPFVVETRLLGYDKKRMQVFHEMFDGTEHFLAATYEVMMLHVNVEALRSAPMPAEIIGHFERVYTAHKTLPRPVQVGRSVKQLSMDIE
jgi:acyl-CoA thioesterase FadM